MPKPINVYLKYMNNDLYYSYTNNENDFHKLEESTATGVDLGDDVNFIVSDASISEITKIKVNQKKAGGKPFKKMWEIEPEPYQGLNTHYRGIIKDEINTDEQVFNGYTIYYETSEGSKEKDPDTKYPPEP